jgi:uncharacterized protein with HEPN domain
MSEKDKHSLLTIREAVKKIGDYSADFADADTFYANQLNFDAAMMNFVVIGEMIDRLSDRFKESHNEIDWLKIKGFRNLVAHDYLGIDAEEVWQIVQNHLPAFEQHVDKILESMNS